MNIYRDLLKKLIIDKAYNYSEEPIYELVSGRKSNHYFNLKKITHHSIASNFIGDIFVDIIYSNDLIKTDSVGGLTMGADPIACSIKYTASCKYNFNINSFSVRKEPKNHGMGSQIEGCVKPGDNVIIVDDVVTTGGSSIKAIEVCRENDLNVLACIALVDRCEDNGRQNIESIGVKFFSVFDINDFLKESSPLIGKNNIEYIN